MGLRARAGRISPAAFDDQSCAGLVRARRTASGLPPPDAASRYYAAVRDTLDFAWQLRFFPIYVEIPIELFATMGGEEIVKAQQVIGDAVEARGMVETNLLAAESVSRMNPEAFRMVSDALAQADTRQNWDIFANKLTALALAKDKRISKADIVALADYLHLLNVHALRVIFDLQLAREQMARFLATATAAQGRELFLAVFGPLPCFGAGEAAAQRQRSYANDIETALRCLVAGIKELTARFKRDAPEFVSDCLKLVCEARRDGVAAEIRNLAPAG